MTLLQELESFYLDARLELDATVEVEPTGAVPHPSALPLEKNAAGHYVWKRVDNVAVVATDLKSSTSVSYAKQDQIGARLFQTSTGNSARILSSFDPGFVDIQGDGMFAIYSGERFVERAMAAAISLNSFSHRLAALLAERFGDAIPEMNASGLKIGLDAGTILVKKIGVRGDHNEPVWAGKPVIYASKCAQAADASEIVATSRYFAHVRDNEYVRYSCGCSNGTPSSGAAPLWRPRQVETLGHDSSAFELVSSWCDLHGDQFSDALLRGETRRGLDRSILREFRDPVTVEGIPQGE